MNDLLKGKFFIVLVNFDLLLIKMGKLVDRVFREIRLNFFDFDGMMVRFIL